MHFALKGSLPSLEWIADCHCSTRSGLPLGRDLRAPLTAEKCDESECSKRLDDILPLPYEQDLRKSQLWNEMSFIHLLRMIAGGIEEYYEQAVGSVSERCGGAFKATAIKGYGRMANKCISKYDHYDGAYPRCVACTCARSCRIGSCMEIETSGHSPHADGRANILANHCTRPAQNIDINRSACTFEKPEDLLSFIDGMKAHPCFSDPPCACAHFISAYQYLRRSRRFTSSRVIVDFYCVSLAPCRMQCDRKTCFYSTRRGLNSK